MREVRVRYLGFIRAISAIALGILVSTCGGSDAPNVPPPPPPPPPPAVNNPPVLTSASTASVTENMVQTGYIATASDADGDALSFSLSGADAALLAVDPASGALSFVAGPDFEAPQDGDANNIYEIIVQVSDGTVTATLNVSVTVRDSALELSASRLIQGLVEPMYAIGKNDGTNRILVVGKRGIVQIINPATKTAATTPFLDISFTVSTDREDGLYSLAFDPDFATNGHFYVFVTNAARQDEVRRYTVAASTPDVADTFTEEIILQFDRAGNIHHGGWIGFGPDANLYITTGDSGVGDTGVSQNTASYFGKVLRIDVSSDDFPGDATKNYRIPAGNPLVGSAGLDEIWAIGFRNPFRASIDQNTGNLFIGDVQESSREEIDMLPSGVSGLNLGWPVVEADLPFQGQPSPSFAPPVLIYNHGPLSIPFTDIQGNSVLGGVVYNGSVAALRGNYVFADTISNHIWSVPAADLIFGTTKDGTSFNKINEDIFVEAGDISTVVAIGEDDNGDLLFVDFLDGEVFLVK